MLKVTSLLFALGLSATPLSASPFDATWKADLTATKFDVRPEFLLLKNGIYECNACTPPVRIPADGQPHATPGRDFADAMSATVIDDRVMRVTSFKDGKKFSEFTRTLSVDGNVMTTVMHNLNVATGEWKTSTTQLRRVGPAPAGTYAQSGYWSPIAAGGGQQIILTLKLSHGRLSMRDADNSSYVARFDGTRVPISGDANATVSLRRLGKRSFQETNFVRGKMTAINTYTLVGANTLTIDSHNVRSGFTDRYVLMKQ